MQPRSLRRLHTTQAVPCAPRQPRARDQLAGGDKTTAAARARHGLATTPGVGCGARLALRVFNFPNGYCNSNYNCPVGVRFASPNVPADFRIVSETSTGVRKDRLHP